MFQPKTNVSQSRNKQKKYHSGSASRKTDSDHFKCEFVSREFVTVLNTDAAVFQWGWPTYFYRAAERTKAG